MFFLHSHPPGSTGSSTFVRCQMKHKLFSLLLKFQVLIHYTLEVMTEKNNVRLYRELDR